MKKQYNALKKLVFALVLLFAGVQGVYAALACEGTIYLKLPSGWTTAYTVAGGQFIAFKKSSQFAGWVELSAESVGGTNDATEFFISSRANDYGQYPSITPKIITTDGEQVQFKDGSGFNCRAFGKNGELWIQPDPSDPTKPYISDGAADVKYFRIMLPEDVKWKSAIPLMSVGGAAGKPMDADPDRCGWYFWRFVDEEPPTEVLIYRDDDEKMEEAIGMEGDWGVGKPTAIDLSSMFAFLGSDEIFFIAANEFADKTNPAMAGWSATDPYKQGACGYDLAAYIYDTDASLHGAFTCSHYEQQCEDNPDVCKNNSCYYPNAPYNVVSSATAVVPCIGVTPGMVTDVLDATTKKPALTDKGRSCFGSQADEAFTAMFNPTPGVNQAFCFNMPFKQTDDGKYEFDSDNYQGPPGAEYPAPGGFYPAEKTPTDLLTERIPAAENKRLAEGPVFLCTNGQFGDGLRAINPQEGVPEIDLLCSGPGWKGGIDCTEKFANGGEWKESIRVGNRTISFDGDGWGWGCPQDAPVGWTFYSAGEKISGTKVSKNQNPEGNARWTSGDPDTEYGDVLKNAGRNQHFCFESHANFRYKKGLRFSFRGDDDIWVYIDNKLAVDLGGTHLAAPGYVDLDNFKGASGELKIGQEYDIDIFFCDRRTTMSNVRIKTNMFIKQQTGLNKTQTNDGKGGVGEYEVCWSVSSDGSCGGGSGGTLCGPALCKYLEENNMSIDYSLKTDKGDVILTPDSLAANKVYKGGIDLTQRCNPVISRGLIEKLSAGNYSLVANIGNGEESWGFVVEGNLEVVNENTATEDINGLPVQYNVVQSALASSDDNPSRVPIYITSVLPAGEDLDLDFEGAAGESYTLSVTDVTGAAAGAVQLEYKDADGTFKTWNGKTPRKIGESGIDTIYASLSMAFMNAEQETYIFSVSGGSLTLPVVFYVPKLVFVESDSSLAAITGDPADYERFVGPVYTFYVLALAPSMTNPGSYEECGTRCNFRLYLGSTTSSGIAITDSLVMVNGRATVNIYSTKEYRVAGDGELDNPALLSITGPKATLINAIYQPLHFKKPPVPYPVFADMFDSRGKKSSVELNMKEPYFQMAQDYLDGIADSLVIYYNRPFYNHPDSLPNRIVVFWDDEDSVVVQKEAFASSIKCGAAAKVADTLCEQRVVVSGIDFSKDIKTTSPSANLKSYARYSDRGKVKEDPFPGIIKDRVAPIIKSADVRNRDEQMDVMTLTLSEPVRWLDQSFEKAAFTVYLNSASNLKTPEQKYVVGVQSKGAATIGGDKVTIIYASSDANPTPHTGDYIRFRTDTPIWADTATIAVPGDTLRNMLTPADNPALNWNSPTSYDSKERLPSPWASVTGEAEVGVKSITYTTVSPDIVNKVDKKNIKITSVKPYDVTVDYDEVVADNPGKLGYFLKSDMNSLIYSDTVISKWFTDPNNKGDIANVYLEVQMDLFSNLGNFVAHDVVKIKCDDKDIYGEGHTCLDTQRNFFISWNLVSAEKRLVGTGAYVSKMMTSVHLSKFGKKNKMDETQMWGVRRTKKAKKMTAEIVNE